VVYPFVVVFQDPHVLVSEVCQDLEEYLSNIFFLRDLGIISIEMAYSFDGAFCFRQFLDQILESEVHVEIIRGLG
jgi:hypothetical protein